MCGSPRMLLHTWGCIVFLYMGMVCPTAFLGLSVYKGPTKACWDVFPEPYQAYGKCRKPPEGLLRVRAPSKRLPNKMHPSQKLRSAGVPNVRLEVRRLETLIVALKKKRLQKRMQTCSLSLVIRFPALTSKLPRPRRRRNGKSHRENCKTS